MLKSRKFLLLMALVLCFTLLTACGGDDADTTDDAGTTDAGSSDAGASNTDGAATGTPTNPNAGAGDAATVDKVDPDDENAPQGTGEYTEIAAVVTKVADNTVSYDIYGYISDEADADSDTIKILDRVFEKTSLVDSFTAENPDTFPVNIYNASAETIDDSSFGEIAVGDVLILLTDSETDELTGVIIYPAE